MSAVPPTLLAGDGLVIFLRDLASGEFWRLDRPGSQDRSGLHVELAFAPMAQGAGSVWRLTWPAPAAPPDGST